jgi:hypothetical protein
MGLLYKNFAVGESLLDPGSILIVDVNAELYKENRLWMIRIDPLFW